MNSKNYTLSGLIFVFIIAALFISCSNDEQINISSLDSKNILQEYANIHNSGLDYIKNDVQKTYKNICTPKQLDEVLDKYVISICEKDSAQKIMQEIAPVKKLLFNGHIPSLTKTRSNISTDVAKTAANECMEKIKNHLSCFKDDEIFDNSDLLEDLHIIIIETYNTYASKCSTEQEKQTLTQVLGVLYGSIEYWTNSKNVESWIKIENDVNKSSENVYNSTKSPKREEKKEEKKEATVEKKEDDNKLSKAEYVTVVAAADTAGAFLGAAVASGPAAVAASAAAGLYFDIK